MIFSKKKEIDLLLKQVELQLEEGSTLAFELDRLIAAKAVKSGVDYYDGYILDQYSCPKCGRPIGDEVMTFPYCPGCGKKIIKP